MHLDGLDQGGEDTVRDVKLAIKNGEGCRVSLLHL